MLVLSIWGLFTRFVMMMVPALCRAVLPQDFWLKSVRLSWYEYFPLTMMRANMDSAEYKEACMEIFGRRYHPEEDKLNEAS